MPTSAQTHKVALRRMIPIITAKILQPQLGAYCDAGTKGYALANWNNQSQNLAKQYLRSENLLAGQKSGVELCFEEYF